MPESAVLVAVLRSQGVAAVISGAGPTVLALTDEATAEKALAEAGPEWAAHRLALDLEGACVLPLSG
jgi:homoserine kinase